MQPVCDEWGLAVANGRLQIGQSNLEILADHLVHADEDADHLGEERHRSLQGPCHRGGAVLGHQGEGRGVVRFERGEEIKLEVHARHRAGGADFHASAANVPVAFPGIDRALAAGGATETALHRGIALLPRRPRTPLAEVGQVGVDLVRWCLDVDGTLDHEGVRLGAGVAQQAEERRGDPHQQHLEHGALRAAARRLAATRF